MKDEPNQGQMEAHPQQNEDRSQEPRPFLSSGFSVHPSSFILHPSSLQERLARELAARWEQGDRVPVEELLARSPELLDAPEAALELVYEEVCLRQRHGLAVEPAEFHRRFPQWREGLEVLFRCHSLFEGQARPSALPAAGESLGSFHLLAELGRGSVGRVFLASQPALGGRLVVLKVTPRLGREHVSLARLQHTHIVPLYWAEDDR